MVEFFTIISLTLIYISLYFSTLFLLNYFKNKKRIYEEPLLPKKLPRVSVIIPAFNEEKTIAATLDSVIALHYPKNLLEVIVINDGSTDKTRAIANRYAQQYNYVKVLNKTNSGKADSLNKGISIIKGEFFVVLDADSYIHPEAIYKSIGFFSDSNVAAVTPPMCPRNTKKIIEKIQYWEYVFSSVLKLFFQSIKLIYVTHGVGSIFRTKIIKKIGGFDTKNLTEDLEIALRIYKYNYKIKSTIFFFNTTEVPKTFKSLWNQRIRWMMGTIQSLIKYKLDFLKLQPNILCRIVFPFMLINVIILFLSFFIISYFLLNQIYNTFLLLYYHIIVGQSISFYFDFFISGLTALTTGLLILFFVSIVICFKTFRLDFKKSIIYFARPLLFYILFYVMFSAFVVIMSSYKVLKGDIQWFK
ncbi:glycosyltransferase [archaeon]|nr:glycosyltransferase [archaeon]